MAKKLRFPLILRDNYPARTLEEVREYFDLEKILNYYQNGRLLSWLENQNYVNEATQIQDINTLTLNLPELLCNILGVTLSDSEPFDTRTAIERQKLISHLKQYTSEEDILEHLELVAFNQEYLSDLLDEECSTIYLFNNTFRIPLGKCNTTYIGIGNVTISNFEAIKGKYQKNNIKFVNIEQTKYDYTEMIERIRLIKEKNINVSIYIDHFSATVSAKSYYDAKEHASVSEKTALKNAKNAVFHAYLEWSSLFDCNNNWRCMYRGGNNSCESYLETQCNIVITSIEEIAENLYTDLYDISKEINDGKLREQYIEIIGLLKNISPKIESYKILSEDFVQQVKKEMGSLHTRFCSEQGDCEERVTLSKAIVMGINEFVIKERYVLSSPSVLQQLCDYTNSMIAEFSDYLYDSIITYMREPMRQINDTSETVYQKLANLLQ